jgi:hypothetical protein
VSASLHYGQFNAAFTGRRVPRWSRERVQDVTGAMKKEIHRMELRKGELDRTKEQLIKELERSIEKRDVISMKARASAANAKKHGGKLTETQLLRKCDDLHKSIADTEAECAATDARTATFDKQRGVLAEQMELVAMRCGDLKAKDRAVSREVQDLLGTKTARLLQTERLQAASALFEGGPSPQLPEEDGLSMFQEGLQLEQAAIRGVVEECAATAGEAAPHLRRALLHADALQVL